MTKNITDTQDLTTNEILDLLKSTLENHKKDFAGTDFVLAQYLIQNREEVPRSFVSNYLRLLEELLCRRSSPSEFVAAIEEGKTEEPQTALVFMDAKHELSTDWRNTFPRATSAELAPGITDTRGWSTEDIQAKLEQLRDELDWHNTTGSARKWWEAFEEENKTRPALVLRLCEELKNRKATITAFFLAYVYSNTDNIQANLHFLDYTCLKEEERKRKEKAASASSESKDLPTQP